MLNGLQALRACAAILVILNHASGLLDAKAGIDEALDVPWLLGRLGVEIFFVISGFTMVLSHADDFGYPHTQRKFFIKRVARIVPLYWTITSVYYIKLIAIGMRQVLSLFFCPYFSFPIKSLISLMVARFMLLAGR
jgi:exopolysaccharide production protein ExoZ